jgi:hypothetical protein
MREQRIGHLPDEGRDSFCKLDYLGRCLCRIGHVPTKGRSRILIGTSDGFRFSTPNVDSRVLGNGQQTRRIALARPVRSDGKRDSMRQV